MNANLVSMIMQSLSSETVGRIAAALGIDQSIIQRAMGAAVPAMLGSMANIASTPDGAQRLANATSQMAGAEHLDVSSKGFVDEGWSMISSLLGHGPLETISSVVAQYAGFGQGAAKRLLAYVAPFVLGTLRKEQVNSGLDARGLASLLASQRGNIERSLPAGVARRLEDAEVQDTRRPAAAQRGYMQEREAPSASGRWAYWLLPALILAGLAAYLLPWSRETKTTQEATRTAPVTTPAQPVGETPAVPRPVASLEDDIVSNVSKLRTALQGIKDPATAQTALPELRDIASRFSKLKAQAQLLTPESRKALATAISNRIPDLNTLFDRFTAEPSLVGDAKPTIDSVRTELNGLAKA